jgi:hypothetical protein
LPLAPIRRKRTSRNPASSTAGLTSASKTSGLPIKPPRQSKPQTQNLSGAAISSTTTQQFSVVWNEVLSTLFYRHAQGWRGGIFVLKCE